MHLQTCCFAQSGYTYCFFDVLDDVAVVVAKAPSVFNTFKITAYNSDFQHKK